MVNQNIQESLKKFQDKKKIKNMRKHKQKNEVIGALNKHKIETEYHKQRYKQIMDEN
jgi:hypothetical protein